MIIFDYNQVAISNLMEHIGSTNGPVDESMVRHMILNTIRTYVKKYKQSHGPEVVIACDSVHFWRKDLFPNYKANRKKARQKSGHDWNSIFACLHLIKDEIRQHSPYKVVEIDTCEADDVIAILTMKHCATQKIMILSSDKDFVQLQKWPNVEQYSPIMKKALVEPLPAVQLKQLIIRGDKSDGVPNILSNDDVFVEGIRQRPITEKKIINWLNQDPKEFCTDEMYRNFIRNEMLIDLTKIPENLKEQILKTYDEATTNSKQEFMNYMITYRLKNLLEVIDEF